MAKANPFRFSTKYQDDETDLLYYGKRYYSANTGRWMSRDPIQEKGGLSLYVLAANNAISRVDFLGTTLVTSTTPFPGAVEELPNLYILNYDDGFPDHTRQLITLTPTALLEEEKKVAKRLRGKCWLQVFNPWDESNFDTGFFAYFDDREYYLFEGKVYADNEINYFGIGMYEAWAGDPKYAAEGLTYIWKQWQYHEDPSPATYYWLNKGYDDYPTVVSMLSTSQPSSSTGGKRR